jgi:hypothetical protein
MPEHDVITRILGLPAFGLDASLKSPLLLECMRTLTEHHVLRCEPYRKISRKFWGAESAETLEALPFLPVRLFKHERLSSVSESEVVKTMTSSGTTGQTVSQIFLDKQTSAMQVKVLSRIMADFIGPKRLPMLVVDCRATVADRLRFSARTAGILGFSLFGREIEYALDDDMSLAHKRVEAFTRRHAGQPLLVFGFTSIVWQHLVQVLESSGDCLDLEQGLLIHGGGWKKLQSEAVEPAQFKLRLNAVTGIDRVHNYYGMVEQTGSIFMECEKGHLHASVWSDVIVRDPVTFDALPDGHAGLIQLLSVIPHSYPGHSLLSEDEGIVLGVDNCLCGRMGRYFSVLGRIQDAEPRGCSDTYSR